MLAAMTVAISGASFLVEVLFAFGCASIARSKGRHTIVWAILGFFFSIVALLIVFLLPRKRW